MLVTVGTNSAEHSLISQLGMGSESDCLLGGQLNRILEISDSDASLKVDKSGMLLEKRVSVEMLM